MDWNKLRYLDVYVKSLFQTCVLWDCSQLVFTWASWPNGLYMSVGNSCLEDGCLEAGTDDDRRIVLKTDLNNASGLNLSDSGHVQFESAGYPARV